MIEALSWALVGAWMVITFLALLSISLELRRLVDVLRVRNCQAADKAQALARHDATNRS